MAAANSSSIGSISGEWNAWLTAAAWSCGPCPAQHAVELGNQVLRARRPRASAAVLRPRRHYRPGRLARDLASGWPGSAAMAPPAGSPPMSRAAGGDQGARAPAGRRTPATWAAAISPTEWPMTASGTRPIEPSSRASATCKANRPCLRIGGVVKHVNRAAVDRPGTVRTGVVSASATSGPAWSALAPSSSGVVRPGVVLWRRRLPAG